MMEIIHGLALQGEDLGALVPRTLRLDDRAELGVREELVVTLECVLRRKPWRMNQIDAHCGKLWFSKTAYQFLV